MLGPHDFGGVCERWGPEFNYWKPDWVPTRWCSTQAGVVFVIYVATYYVLHRHNPPVLTRFFRPPGALAEMCLERNLANGHQVRKSATCMFHTFRIT